MAIRKSTLLLCLLVFLAFGFQTIGVFTSPLAKSKLSLAKTTDTYYGVFGYCDVSDNALECTGYTVGYDINDDELQYISSSNGRKILTEILVSHVVAAGLQLIALLCTFTVGWKSLGWYVVMMLFFVFTFLVTLLSFIVEILLFRTKLQFAGWFTLAATVLSVLYIVLFGFFFRRCSEDKYGLNDDDDMDEENLIDNGKSFFFADDEKPFDGYNDLPSLPEAKNAYMASEHSAASAISNGSNGSNGSHTSSMKKSALNKTQNSASEASSVYSENRSLIASQYSSRDPRDPRNGSSMRNMVSPPAGALGAVNPDIPKPRSNRIRMPQPDTVSQSSALNSLPGSAQSAATSPAEIGATAADIAATASASAMAALARAGSQASSQNMASKYKMPAGSEVQPTSANAQALGAVLAVPAHQSKNETSSSSLPQVQQRQAQQTQLPQQSQRLAPPMQSAPQSAPQSAQPNQQSAPQSAQSAPLSAQPTQQTRPQTQGMAVTTNSKYTPPRQAAYSPPASHPVPQQVSQPQSWYPRQPQQTWQSQQQMQYYPRQQYSQQYSQQYAPQYAQQYPQHYPQQYSNQYQYAPQYAQTQPYAPQRQPPQTSDFALRSNPDFSVPRANRRRPR